MPERLRGWLLPTAMVILASLVAAGLLTAGPASVDRGEALAGRLRCPVCQSESVADSPSETARAMRERVDELIAAGLSDADIEQHFVDRYGEWILLDPPPGPRTWALWALPLAGLAGGVLAVWRLWGGRRIAEPTPDQRAIVAEALAEHDRVEDGR